MWVLQFETVKVCGILLHCSCREIWEVHELQFRSQQHVSKFEGNLSVKNAKEKVSKMY